MHVFLLKMLSKFSPVAPPEFFFEKPPQVEASGVVDITQPVAICDRSVVDLVRNTYKLFALTSFHLTRYKSF